MSLYLHTPKFKIRTFRYLEQRGLQNNALTGSVDGKGPEFYLRRSICAGPERNRYISLRAHTVKASVNVSEGSSHEVDVFAPWLSTSIKDAILTELKLGVSLKVVEIGTTTKGMGPEFDNKCAFAWESLFL